MWFVSAKHRTLERYARDLPGLLSARYGSSATYTEGQVRRTVEIAGLGDAHIEYALARFLSKEDFDRLYTPGNYTFLRTDLLREMAEATGDDSLIPSHRDPPLSGGTVPAMEIQVGGTALSDAFD